MGLKNKEKVYKPINLFEFGLNENNEYVNLKEEAEKAAEQKYKTYSFEEIIKGHELDDNFFICASFHTGCFSQYGRTIEEIRNEINKESESKCYHYGNLEKGIYVYSFKVEVDDDEDMYWIVIENEKHIVVVRHTGNINDILFGKEMICYPACCVYMFEKTDVGLKQINSGYGNYKSDIRYKVLCGEFKILEFSTNRIDQNKKPIDFYEAQFKLSDFINYWGTQKINEEVE